MVSASASPTNPIRPTLLNVLEKKNAPCSFPPPASPLSFWCFVPPTQQQSSIKLCKTCKAPKISCTRPGLVRGAAARQVQGARGPLLLGPRAPQSAHAHKKETIKKKKKKERKENKSGACRNHREMLKSSRANRFLFSVNITNVIHHHNHKIHLTY